MQIDNNQLLRFTTAGSVDDGKSTLIGRLLYDSKSIYQDQYEEIMTASEKRGIGRDHAQSQCEENYLFQTWGRQRDIAPMD